MSTAAGTFDVTITPGPGEAGGLLGRFELTKTWHGDVEGIGTGVMLSAGDPASGSAGYVAIETVQGSVAGREGVFALQQLGTMHAGAQDLRYLVVPGSGTGALAGMSGELTLEVVDGEHRYTLEYELLP